MSTGGSSSSKVNWGTVVALVVAIVGAAVFIGGLKQQVNQLQDDIGEMDKDAIKSAIV